VSVLGIGRFSSERKDTDDSRFEDVLFRLLCVGDAGRFSKEEDNKRAYEFLYC